MNTQQPDLTINKKALYTLSYGIYIVASVKEDEKNAQVANTVFQVSSQPPTVAVSINKQNLTHEFIKHSKLFSVTTLSQDTPLPFIGGFGFYSGRGKDKFKDINYIIGKTGCPIIIDNGVAFLEAKVIEEVDVYTHTIFVGEVKGADILKSGTPMTYSYYRGKKGTSPKTAPTYIEGSSDFLSK